MAKCIKCGKGPQFGHNRSHSLRATNRQFKVNVQKATVMRDGRPTKVTLCAQCLKTLAKT